MTESVADILSETEQSIKILSVVCRINFEPERTSNEEPAGIETSFTTKVVVFATGVPATSPTPPSVVVVSDETLTDAVTAELCTLHKINPRTTDVVLA